MNWLIRLLCPTPYPEEPPKKRWQVDRLFIVGQVCRSKAQADFPDLPCFKALFIRNKEDLILVRGAKYAHYIIYSPVEGFLVEALARNFTCIQDFSNVS